MVSLIIKMLDVADFEGISENIDVAKGKNKMQTSLKGAWRQRKRTKAWQ